MAEDLSRPAFRYSSSGRRPERLNQSRGVNAPLQLLRGWAAGTLGLPGDIEGLVRMLPGIKDETPVLPTSDFYREWLPGYDERPAARAMSGLGALTGGMGATNVARAGLGAVKRATDVNAIRDYVRAAQGVSGMPGAAVIKPKGGNWLAGSVEGAVRPLRNADVDERAYMEFNRAQAQSGGEFQDWLTQRWREDPDYQKVPAIQAANEFLRSKGLSPLAPEGPDAALNKWIDQKLAGYIRNEMGTPEDPLRLQAEAFGPKKAALLKAKNAQIAKAEADMERARAARGFTPEMMTQSQARLRDLRRERSQIEAQTGLHIYPGFVSTPPDVAKARVAAGFPEEGMAAERWLKTPPEQMTDEASLANELAYKWEVLADAPISPEGKAGELAGIQSALDRNPWLAKASPEATVYSLYPGSTVRNENLGFGHLVDELRNAVNPESGLPRELLLKYEDLPKLSVAQAAKRVDDINAWRAAQKAEADLARAMNPATQVFKEYPEQGYKWVELKMPEKTSGLPEGYSLSVIRNERLPEGHMGARSYAVVDPQGRMLEDVGLEYTEADALDKFSRAYYGRALEDALKYEGEQLSHCVGGYCPDVVEGRSRIFSLRDAEGRPHVTVEVKPDTAPPRHDHIIDEIKRVVGSNNIPDDDAYDALYKQAMASVMANRPQDIIQIKGKANKAPKEEYLPFVQDFVRSGQWGRVGDLGNTGLIDLNVSGVPENLREGRRFVPKEEYDAIVRRNAEGFARGGAVTAPPGPAQYDPLAIDSLAEQLLMEA
jgi:hypothetical protein